VEFRIPKRGDGILYLRVYSKSVDYNKIISTGIDQPGSYAEIRDYGDHAFALESDGHLLARRAEEAEWMAAERIETRLWGQGPPESLPKGSIGNGPAMKDAAMEDAEAFEYDGKRFPYHGRPGRFILSPKHSRVATLSAQVGRNNVGQFNSDPYTYFLDIFDLTTGALVSSAQGSVRTDGLPWVSLIDEPAWVTDRYFYMPLFPEHDHLLMFDFGSSH
jgi:hypothetical protein